MKYTDNALNLLTVREFPKKGPAWICNNLKGHEDLGTLCSLLKVDEDEFLEKRRSVEKSIKRLDDFIDGVTALGDSNFPRHRGIVNFGDRPFALFYKGNIDLLKNDNLNVAVIGVLNPDEKIELTETIVTQEIIKYDATIVSGLALGCDTIAHKVALESCGKTIAILPCPLDEIIPKENADLANRIVEHGGLLVSEYYKKTISRNALVGQFVARDRLQAMFSDAILLVASYAQNNLGNDCGSRHAMGKAKDYGVKRAVIYNEAKHGDNPMYDLNRQILQDDLSVIRIDSGNRSDMVKKLVRREMDVTLNFDLE